MFTNEIWFVAGMILFLYGEYLDNIKRYIGFLIITIFSALSVYVYMQDITTKAVSFGLGVVACMGLVLLVRKWKKENILMSFLANYTMPIFLMHTMIAAPIRTILLKMGIQHAAVHVVVGLVISFIGPILAAEIMKRFRWMEFFLYPGKYIKLR